MRKKDAVNSGFIGINTGDIKNCYSEMKTKSKIDTSAFCYRNEGEIENCWSRYICQKENSKEFCKDNLGTIQSCFYISNSESNNEKVAEESDIQVGKDNSFSVIGLTENELRESVLENAGWDLEKTWTVSSGKALFKNRNFKVINNSKDDFQPIENAEDLFEFVNGVNEGKEEYINGKFILKKDLNLKGASWKPIGTTDLNGFRGIFDGDGHRIKNFVVKDKKLEYGGFFGHIDGGTVINLVIDGIIKAGRYRGSFAAVNNEGTIKACAVGTNILLKSNCAGFVWENSGTIESCLVVGKSKKDVLIPLPYVGLISAGLILSAVLGWTIYNKTQETKLDYYPPVGVASDIQKVDDLTPATGENKTTISYSGYIEAEHGTGTASFNYKNPGSSNHHVVVNLQITDAVLMDKVGKTGRTQEEQEKLDALNYDKTRMRVTVGKTGAVPPGYAISTIELNALPDGTVLPAGEYDAVIYMDLYDINTNEKAAMQTQAPIKLLIKN